MPMMLHMMGDDAMSEYEMPEEKCDDDDEFRNSDEREIHFFSDVKIFYYTAKQQLSRKIFAKIGSFSMAWRRKKERKKIRKKEKKKRKRRKREDEKTSKTIGNGDSGVYLLIIILLRKQLGIPT